MFKLLKCDDGSGDGLVQAQEVAPVLGILIISYITNKRIILQEQETGNFSRLLKDQIQDVNKIKSSHVSKEKTNLMQEAPAFSLLRMRNCTMLFRN